MDATRGRDDGDARREEPEDDARCAVDQQPDGKTIALPTTPEYRQADTRAPQSRERVQRDSITYFPPMASQPCRIGFFADLESRAMAYDEFELSSTRACLGRLYAKVPGGITSGQHWLNVKFANSQVRVPFRITRTMVPQVSQFR